MIRCLAFVLCLWASADSFAFEPFFAPAVPSGSIEVKLHPTEALTPGVSTLVTFGVPFPRGSLTPAQLATVRVLRAGQEIPAYVDLLTPWRHRSNAAIDAQSVRVARIQIRVTLTAAFPAFETIVVRWGGAPRSLDVATFADARSAWHRVTSGSFVAADNVFEPDVYAVLPADWLTRGAIAAVRSSPFDASNTEARDNPSTNDAIARWPRFQEAERALKNNFYTLINRDDPRVTVTNQTPYKTDREPWLYDRAATMYVLYLRSGFFTALREAVQASQFYGDRLDAQGFFTLAPGDSKYAYNESLAYTLWLTGDTSLWPKIELVTVAHNSFQHIWSPTRNFWTERHAAFKLLAQVIAYEVAGGEARRATVEATLATFRSHQDGANGQVPSPRIDGALYHTGAQHDFDWAGSRYGGSSWMSALLSDAAVRAYATGEDAATARFVLRLGAFLRATTVNTEEHSYDIVDAPLWLSRYAMLDDGSDGQRNFEDIEHSLDVASQIAWAYWFSLSLGEPSAALRRAALDLYASYDEGVNFWIRPGGPAAGLAAFRVSPPRKWGWEHRISQALPITLDDGVNAGYSALWFEAATNGQGFQMELNRASKTLVVGWYTFLPADAAATRSRLLWLFGSAAYVDEGTVVPMFRSRGAQFDAGPAAMIDPVGTLTVRFLDCSNAVASYQLTLDGQARNGEIPLRRLSPDLTCEALRASGEAALAQLPAPSIVGGIQYGHSGSWFDAARPGQGFVVHADPGRRQFLASWYSYDFSDARADGSQPPLWLLAIGEIDGATANTTLFLSLGGVFDAAQPPASAAQPVGTLRFTVTSCANATASYTVTLPGGATRSGTVSLSRLTAPDLCRS